MQTLLNARGFASTDGRTWTGTGFKSHVAVILTGGDAWRVWFGYSVVEGAGERELATLLA